MKKFSKLPSLDSRLHVFFWLFFIGFGVIGSFFGRLVTIREPKSPVLFTQIILRENKEAIRIYFSHCNRFPVDLDELLAKEVKDCKYHNGPYIKRLPIDGWGNNIIYVGSSERAELISFGEDGVLGGRGLKADLSEVIGSKK